ncbi:alpha/beta hydrolase [Plantactinospora endophytica]|uniref:Alpha/beta hydrolase n=1 Tax=Plantactinospora endophytica TaxID=673535 RepID=A0ABQ4DZD7_9ACTN|nr:alpha/beta hydrolase [Plantactinospora endophytica]GIG87795.1 alpha/beta hydrolase [Plantactinospora endophytica]
MTLAVVAAAGTMASARGVSETATPSTLSWGPCPADIASPTLECTTVEVPLDYRHPEGRTIDIAVSRLPSKNSSQRRGVLLTNPGGPGGGGLSYPGLLGNPVFPQPLPQSVRDRYDVIGFDPRGVGHSAPVTCDYTPEQVARLNLPYPSSSAEVRRDAEIAETIARQCLTSETAGMLPYITTANTARDMDRIRKALGEPQISYLGSSYGTYLGAVYTTMFPQRSDRIVLDSNLGPGGYDHTAFQRLALGMEQRFPDFANFAATNPQYGLGTTPKQVRAKYFELAARLAETPVQGIDGSLFRGTTFDLLYTDVGFTTLATIWQALDTGRPLPPAPPIADPDNSLSSRLHVLCGDSMWPRSIRGYQREVAAHRMTYPLIGAATANIGPCAFWPSPIEPPVRIGDRGPSNVLMVQNLRDPGTPLAGARELRKAFGDRARMVTADQGGHGAYLLFARNTCANDTVTTFLTTGQRPHRDVACAAEPS